LYGIKPVEICRKSRYFIWSEVPWAFHFLFIYAPEHPSIGFDPLFYPGSAAAVECW
jgi:hypothetical protein